MRLFYIKMGEVNDILGNPEFSSVYIHHDETNEKISIKKAYLASQISSISNPPFEGTSSFTSLGDAELFIYSEGEGIQFTFEDLKHKWGTPTDYESWVICKYYNMMVQQADILVEPVPIFRMSSSSKIPLPSPAVYDRLQLVSFNIPFSSSVFSDCFMVVTTKDLVVDGDAFEIIEVANPSLELAAEIRTQYLPHIVLSSSEILTPSQHVTVTAQVVDYLDNPVSCEMELFFECVNGSLSHNRRTTEEGSAWTKVSANLMEVGEVVRVKVGSKFFSGLAEISLAVGDAS
jgi:hypothetical protein